MIHIRREGERFRYGFNIEWNRGNTLFQVHLVLPYGKIGPLYYQHFRWDSIAYGEVIKKVRVGFRIRYRIKPRILFHFNTGTVPVNPKYIANREMCEDLGKGSLLDRLPVYI